MSTAKPLPPVVSPSPKKIPPLEQGDHLTLAEFERRYQAMPQLKKAELLEGEVHMPSPVRFDCHGEQHSDFITWLGVYRSATPGVRVGINATIRLDMENEPQPDGAMIIDPQRGGKVQLSEDGYIVGGPELVGEISASTATIDLHTKFRVYRRNQVQEYIVWRVLDQEIDWFVLRETQFERLPLSDAGYYQSEVFSGLWLDPAALIRGDMAKVLAVLQEGLASPAHADFVAKFPAASK